MLSKFTSRNIGITVIRFLIVQGDGKQTQRIVCVGLMLKDLTIWRFIVNGQLFQS